MSRDLMLRNLKSISNIAETFKLPLVVDISGVPLRVLHPSEAIGYPYAKRLRELLECEIKCDFDEAKVNKDDDEQFSTAILKKSFAKKISALLCDKREDLLDEFGNEFAFEPSIGQEDEIQLLEWADKFVNSVGDAAVRNCLRVI